MLAGRGRCSMRSCATVPGRCWPRRWPGRSTSMGVVVVRNGHHHQREVLTAAGAVSVTAPRVNDKRIDADTGERQRFSSAILPAWARKSPQMTEVLLLLYLHGLSTSA